MMHVHYFTDIMYKNIVKLIFELSFFFFYVEKRLPYVLYYQIGIEVNFINKSHIGHYFGTRLWIGWV